MSASLKGWIRKAAARKANWVIGLAILAVLGEVFHHSIENRQFYFEVSFWLEIMVYGFVIPGMALIVLKEIEQRTIERDQFVQVLDSRFQLAEELARPLAWNKLINVILNYPKTVIPLRAAYLHLHDPVQDRFQLEGYTDHLVDRSNSIPALLTNQSCPCLAESSAQNTQITGCPHSTNLSMKRFCLPLAYGDELVGLMHFDLPPGETLTHAQSDALTGAAPEIALALRNAHLEKDAVSQAEAIARERHKIAQDLHDTLGQNIAYLTMKLGYMSSDNALQSIEAITREIDKMRSVAWDAYAQVRSTLRLLDPPAHGCLATAFRDMTRKSGERIGFDFEVVSEGEARQLTTAQQRQVTGIFREVLNNIEKHSGAKFVFIHIAWSRDKLTWQVKDDGCGFNLKQILSEDQRDRYGLTIMRERADELEAHFTVQSAPNQGTLVKLQMPLTGAASIHLGEEEHTL